MRGVALTVATTPIRNGYQLQSPTLRLAAGDYVVAVRGEIRSGGLAVGILDVAANRWLSVTSYSRTADPRPATMTTEVHLSTPRRVAIILSNGPTDGKRSDWLLSQASIASKSAPLVANPLPISSRLVDANHHWRLGSIPSGWTVVSGTRVRTGRNLSVSTTPANNAYQLESPRFVLPAGRYRAAIEGELRSGGIELGVLDTAADRWVNITSYGSTVPPEPTVMVDEFSLAAPRRVQLILSNLSTSGTPSSWLLSQALIAPQSRTTASPHGLALPALAGSGRSSSRR